MTINCTSGWSAETEFSDLTTCSKHVITDLVLKDGTASLATLMLLIEILLVGVRWRTMRTTTPVNVTLVSWGMFQNTLMILVNVFPATLHIRSKTTLWLAFLVHISAASSAGILILFMYIEVTIRSKSLKAKKGLLLRHKGIILIVLGIVQAVIFLIGPIVSHYTSVQLYIMFWVPVVIIDFTLIPYFYFVTYVLYKEINDMSHGEFKSLGKHLLLTGVLCGIIGIFTGTVGLVSIFYHTYEWVLLPACWCSDIVFNFVFIVVLLRRPVRADKAAALKLGSTKTRDINSGVTTSEGS